MQECHCTGPTHVHVVNNFYHGRSFKGLTDAFMAAMGMVEQWYTLKFDISNQSFVWDFKEYIQQSTPFHYRLFLVHDCKDKDLVSGQDIIPCGHGLPQPHPFHFAFYVDKI